MSDPVFLGEISDDIDALARTMFGEARNQAAEGMQAVGNTIMNRVAKQTWYGLTPYEVCHKAYQYSCWNETDPNCEIITQVNPSSPVFADALQIAQGVVNGTLPDLTDGSTHYQVIGTNAAWSVGHTPAVTIGQHQFYNDIE